MAVSRHFLLQGFSLELSTRKWNGVTGAQRRELNIALSSSLHKRQSSFARNEYLSVKFNVQNIYKLLGD